MDEEKSEKPTQRKLQKARERGEVAKSSELAFALLALGSLLLIWGIFSLAQLKEIFFTFFSELSTLTIRTAFQKAVLPLISPLLFFFAAAVLLAIAGHLVQTGWLWSFKRKGKPGFNFLLSFSKIALLGVVGYFLMRQIKPREKMIFSTPTEKITLLTREIFFILVIASFALLLIGLIDLIYQKWRFYKKMHMTKEELREEQREVKTRR